MKIALFMFLSIFVNLNAYILEENESNIITSISNIEVSPDFSKILISDMMQGKIFEYNAKTGKLQYSFKPNIFYNDSIALQKNHDKIFEEKHCTLKQLFDKKGGTYEPELISKWFNNSIKKAVYDNYGNIWAFSLLNVSILMGSDWGMDNVYGLIKIFNKKKHSKIYLFKDLWKDNNQKIAPFHNYLEIEENTAYFQVLNYRKNDKNSKIDIASKNCDLISKFNIKTGEYVSSAFKIPDYIAASDPGYNLMSVFINSVKIKNDYYYSIIYEPYLFCSNKKIKLKGIDEYINYDENSFDEIYSGLQLPNFRVNNIFKYNDNILLLLDMINTKSKTISDRILFEFTTRGELVKKYSIPIKLNKKGILNVFYNDDIEKLIYVLKSDSWEIVYEDISNLNTID